MLLKMVAHSLAFGALLGLLLFLPAGTLAWPQAWVFMALFIGCSEAIGVWLKKTDPDLLAARMKSPISADQKFSDRAVMSAILVGQYGRSGVEARVVAFASIVAAFIHSAHSAARTLAESAVPS